MAEEIITTTEESKKSKISGTDVLCLLGSVIVITVAVFIYTDKIPKNLKTFQQYYSYFYVLAIAGVIGVLGEQYAVTLLGFMLPILLAAATILMRLKPAQFPIEEWWDQYSLVVLFSASVFFIGFNQQFPIVQFCNMLCHR